MSCYTEVFVWGSDSKGQLGLSQSESSSIYPLPRFCSYSVLILKISCGETHSAFIEKSGLVYTVGSNEEGQLGLGRNRIEKVNAPSLVEFLRDVHVADVACGGAHTCVITEDCQVFSWGRGDSGALGTGSFISHFTPTAVPLPSNFAPSAVACGSSHSALIGSTVANSGLLVMCGSGEAGQLGTGERRKEARYTPVPHSEPVKQVSLGEFHSAFVTVLGRVFSMGANNSGQLGIGSRKGKLYPTLVRGLEGVSVQKVACGGHTAAVSSSGEVFIWGSGAFGELLSPVRQNRLPREIVDVSVGTTFGTALDSSGRVWAWGSNSNGELALGDYSPRCVPVAVGPLGQKWVKAVACGGSFAVGLGRDVKAKRGRSAHSCETQRVVRKAQTGPVVWDGEWVESARSTTRVKQAWDFDLESSQREVRLKSTIPDPLPTPPYPSDSTAFRLKLESQVSHLSHELQVLESKLADTSELLFSEQHTRVLLATELETIKSSHSQAKSQEDQHSRQQSSQIQDLTQRCQALESELQAYKTAPPLKKDSAVAGLREKHEEVVRGMADEMRRTSERLQNELSAVRSESENYKSHAEECQARLERLQRDYSLMQEALEKAEAHNAELLSVLDRKSLTRARDYRERSLSMLGTPSPTRSSIIVTEKSSIVLPSSMEDVVLGERDGNRPPTFRDANKDRLGESRTYRKPVSEC